MNNVHQNAELSMQESIGPLSKKYFIIKDRNVNLLILVHIVQKQAYSPFNNNCNQYYGKTNSDLQLLLLKQFTIDIQGKTDSKVVSFGT